MSESAGELLQSCRQRIKEAKELHTLGKDNAALELLEKVFLDVNRIFTEFRAKKEKQEAKEVKQKRARTNLEQGGAARALQKRFGTEAYVLFDVEEDEWLKMVGVEPLAFCEDLMEVCASKLECKSEDVHIQFTKSGQSILFDFNVKPRNLDVFDRKTNLMTIGRTFTMEDDQLHVKDQRTDMMDPSKQVSCKDLYKVLLPIYVTYIPRIGGQGFPELFCPFVYQDTP